MTFLRPLFVSFGALTLLTGLAYPAAFTALAKITFPWQAGGSLLVIDGKLRGSSLIGQATEDPHYFWGRPSSTAPFPTNAAASGGSTLAASNPALAQAISDRIRNLRAVDPDNSAPIPQNLITASASGLDPHISPESAHWQVARIARNRGLTTERVKNLVAQHVQRSLFGPPRVNVLELNLALDAQAHP